MKGRSGAPLGGLGFVGWGWRDEKMGLDGWVGRSKKKGGGEDRGVDEEIEREMMWGSGGEDVVLSTALALRYLVA